MEKMNLYYGMLIVFTVNSLRLLKTFVRHQSVDTRRWFGIHQHHLSQSISNLSVSVGIYGDMLHKPPHPTPAVMSVSGSAWVFQWASTYTTSIVSVRKWFLVSLWLRFFPRNFAINLCTVDRHSWKLWFESGHDHKLGTKFSLGNIWQNFCIAWTLPTHARVNRQVAGYYLLVDPLSNAVDIPSRYS